MSGHLDLELTTAGCRNLGRREPTTYEQVQICGGWGGKSERQSADAILDTSLTSQAYIFGFFMGNFRYVFFLQFKLSVFMDATSSTPHHKRRTSPLVYNSNITTGLLHNIKQSQIRKCTDSL